MPEDLMLEAWLGRALEAAGVGDVERDLLGWEGIGLVLDLAREAAHGVARPAAPLATFAAGIALGRRGADLAALRETATAIGTAADEWGQEL